jgi:hypothetical protein
MKAIRFSSHARGRMRQRGATEDEVMETIRTAPWTDAERGRQECRKDFPFNREWNGRVYASKQVRPVFIEEAQEIIVVTVYVYYA